MPISDTEQMQMIKAWWKEYGYYILFSLLIVVVAKFGWHYWQKNQNDRLEHASVMYMQMLDVFEHKKNEEVKLFGEKLIKSYAKSPYASLAALMLAKNAVQEGDFKLAQEHLQFVIRKAPSNQLRQLARIRAARVLVEMKQSKEAIDLLASIDDKDYLAEINEVLGDALLDIGKINEAEKAYRKAQDMDADKKPSLPLLKMKMMRF